MNIVNKRILVTGASDGIGKEISIKLSKSGAKMILLGRNKEKLESVSMQCQNECHIVACDITDTGALYAELEIILEQGGVDVLINNAGIFHKGGDVTTIADEEIDKIIETNMTAHIKITKKLLPSMRNHETAILNIISKAGVVAQPGLSVYSASKYGMQGFTDVLREDTKDEPIRIAAVYQAGTNTGMFAKSGQNAPLEKFSEPDDLAEVVRFMLEQPEKIWLKEVHIEF